jgi:N-acetyl-anhydromuramyl-L-alanine amidase AmpD
MREIRFIVIHCTAGNQDQKTTDIKAYWANKLGWKSYGYHYLINKDGSIENLTDISKPTNGVKGYNSNSIHVCYKGGQQGKDNRTPYQKLAMLDILIELKKQFPKAIVCGHRDFSPDLNKNGIIEPKEFIKLCPCFDAKSEYKKI